MRHRPVVLWIVLLSLIAVKVSLAGRPVDNWPPDRAWKGADVVVIATAQKSESPDLRGAKDDAWVEVRTTFAVEAVLKGKSVGKTVTVLHYRYQNPRSSILVLDGPAFVSFNTRGQASYLLFLKSTARAWTETPQTLEPVSGQMDPGFSFKRLEAVER